MKGFKGFTGEGELLCSWVILDMWYQWSRKHLLKGVVLIEDREHLFPWQWCCFLMPEYHSSFPGRSYSVDGDKTFGFQLRFQLVWDTDIITSTEVTNIDFLCAVRTASAKIFQVCTVSRLEKKMQQNTLCWRHCLKTLSCHIYKEYLLFLLTFYPKVTHTCRPLEIIE